MDTHTVSCFVCENCKSFFSICNKCVDNNNNFTNHDEDLGIPRCHALKALASCGNCNKNN